MHARRRDQIRFEPDGVEAIAGIELGGDIGAAGGGGMDRDQPLGDRTRGFLAQHAVAQLALPVRIARRVEIFHDEETGVAVLCDEMGNRAGPDRLGRGQPLPFGVVALDRRLPKARHFKLRQSAFEAIFFLAYLDPPDIRRHAAIERRAGKLVARREQAHAGEHTADFTLVERIIARHRRHRALNERFS